MRRLCPPIALTLLLAAACGGETTPLPPVLRLVTATLPPVGFLETFDQTLQAEGGVPPYRFRVSAGALPEGLELRASGQLTGVVATAGRASFTVTVTDSAGTEAAGMLSLYVVPAPLEVVTRSLRSGREGSAYDESLSARGGVAPLVWSVGAGSLPSGLALEAGGRLRGTPSEFGSFPFTARVTDAESTTKDAELTLMISALSPMITTTTVPKARVPEPYELRFSVQGGDPPFSWEVAGGTLPMGLLLSNDGVLAGSPQEAGNFPLMVRVSDSMGHSDMEAFTLRVLGTLDIVTVALPQAIFRRQYNTALQATGGELPYSWSITTGTLPTGITLSAGGVLQGTTAGSGEYPLAIRVTDADGISASAIFSLRVAERYTFEITPTGQAASFPPVCTSTTVSSKWFEIPVTDSLMIADLNVSVDVGWNPNGGGGLRMVLFAPDDSQAPLCANWLTGGFGGCGQQNLNVEYDDEGFAAERPLSVFDGLNPRGTWRLLVTVAQPTCTNVGAVNRVTISVADDRETTPYVHISGYVKNNLIIEPFIHVWSPTSPSPGGVPPHELFLDARVYSVGANGIREAGQGDDVEEAVQMVWSWQTVEAAPGVLLEPSGHVSIDSSSEVCAGLCPGTGQSNMVVSGGGYVVTLPLRVVPPDFDRRKRRL